MGVWMDGWMVALFLDLPHGWLPVDHNFIIIITITCSIIKFYSINSKFHIVSANMFGLSSCINCVNEAAESLGAVHKVRDDECVRVGVCV